MSFGQAFKEARKKGLSTFKWRGKTYGTQLKGEPVRTLKITEYVTPL